MTKRLPSDVKLSRKPTRVACEFCHSKHLQCDDSRPCKNCVKRGQQHHCQDAVRKKKSAVRKAVAFTQGAVLDMGVRPAPETAVKRKKRKYKRRRKQQQAPADEFDGSKAVLPFSLSITTLNNLLGPKEEEEAQSSQDLAAPQTITAPQMAAPHSHPMSTIDPAFQSSTIRVINPDHSAPTSVLNELPLAPLPTDIALSDSDMNPMGPAAGFQFSPPALKPESPNESGPLEFRARSRKPSRASGSITSGDSYGISRGYRKQSSPSSVSEAPPRSETSSKPFMSTTANEEYSKLNDLVSPGLTTTVAAASPTFFEFPELTTDSDDDHVSLPYIEIDIEGNTMHTSYPNNTTPNFVAASDRGQSQLPNTAREIPHDLQEDEDYTSPLIMRHVIKRPDDIYLTSIVKAYQYPKAYHALIAYLKTRFAKPQLIEIAKCMAKYRPSFISATKSLYENDLIFTERSFQRTLLEYEQLISMSPSPTIIWRRTGEIVALTNEFATMTGYSKMSLLSKRTYIVELMNDESALKYFDSFSSMSFGNLNATYLTNCVLRKAQDNDYLKCCCIWTIKRDVFDIPMLIVGQFLPVLT